MSSSPRNRAWVASKFNVQTRSDDDHLILYNSFTGNIGAIPPEMQAEALAVLRSGLAGEPSTEIAADLIGGGFMVPAESDEFRRERWLYTQLRGEKRLHLILFPTEECNFRCVYCYETFQRGKMAPDVRQGIVSFLEANARQFPELEVTWFGGEPLEAMDVIQELSAQFRRICAAQRVRYSSSISTNGYGLTPEVFATLLDLGVNAFQITLDGPPHQHDRLRVLSDGSPTFDVIWRNLRALKQVDRPFAVYIRVNLDSGSAKHMEPFLDQVRSEFAGDPRFQIYFRPVARWGGPNDHQLQVCDTQALQWDLSAAALARDLPMTVEFGTLNPGGAICYASRPNSFLIGADGTVRKCTVALEDPRNHVGQLHPDGTMELDPDKLALWVTADGEHDRTCATCFFKPACHGAACPLNRLNTGKAPCPPHKTAIKRVIKLAYLQSERLGNADLTVGTNNAID